MSEQPKYVGLLPWMAQWWIDHLPDRPVVVIRCGHGDPQCRNAIGEIKTDESRVMAMSKNEHPEVTTGRMPLAAPTVEELAAEIAELERQVLRYVGDDGVVFKRTTGPSEVAPVEDLSYYVCRTHGEMDVDTGALALFVAEALSDTQKRTRTYWAHRPVD